MSRKQHNEEQIIYALKRVKSGIKGLKVCREMGISEQALYLWKRKYGGNWGCESNVGNPSNDVGDVRRE
jgi:transposase-like protein